MKPTAEHIAAAADEINAAFKTIAYKSGGFTSECVKFVERKGFIYVGSGCTRVIVKHPKVKGVVFKIEKAEWGQTEFGNINKSEQKAWEALKGTEVSKFLAEVYGVYHDGAILAMKEVKGLTVRDARDLYDRSQFSINQWYDLEDKLNEQRRDLAAKIEGTARNNGIRTDDLHGSNFIASLLFGGKRVRMVAVDYGGAYEWHMNK